MKELKKQMFHLTHLTDDTEISKSSGKNKISLKISKNCFKKVKEEFKDL